MKNTYPSPMDSAGQRAEAAGDLDGAVRAYVAARQLEEAARLLFSMQRYLDAARVLLSGVGPQPTADPVSLARAQNAAVCLAHAGDAVGSGALSQLVGDEPRGRAASRPIDSGSIQRAIDAHAHAGQVELAARLARLMGEPARAAAYFMRARMAFEAGVSHYEASDLRSALAAFQLVPVNAPVYRNACLNAIHVAVQLDAVSFELDEFLASFIQSEPLDTAELAAFYELGVLYQKVGYDADARDLFGHILRIDPRYRDVGQRLALLDRGPGDDLSALLKDDVGFWGRPKPSLASGDKSGDRPRSEAPQGGTEALKARTESRRPIESTERRSRGEKVDAATSSPRASTAPRDPVSKVRLAKGDLVAARYRIEDEIGRGGMSTVFRANDLELGMHVALKVFQASSGDGSMMARFKQELMICRQLSHANIIRLHDIGSDEGRKFISMELLSGRILREMIGHVDLGTAIYYMHQVAVGLSVVHHVGVVHRDIKPTNLFLTTNDVVKIMDFGIAKRRDTALEGLTGTGFVAGTAGYMAPEQYTDFARVSHAADIYSLGVVGYELVTGQRLYSDDTVEVLYKQMTEVPPLPSTKVGGVPQDLDSLIMRMISRKVQDRPSSCDEIAEELVALASRL